MHKMNENIEKGRFSTKIEYDTDYCKLTQAANTGHLADRGDRGMYTLGAHSPTPCLSNNWVQYKCGSHKANFVPKSKKSKFASVVFNFRHTFNLYIRRTCTERILCLLKSGNYYKDLINTISEYIVYLCQIKWWGTFALVVWGTFGQI